MGIKLGDLKQHAEPEKPPNAWFFSVQRPGSEDHAGGSLLSVWKMNLKRGVGAESLDVFVLSLSLYIYI